MKKISLVTLLGTLLIISQLNAKEGMWIPLLINELNYEDLKSSGFRLSSEEIYSINQACLKDAVVIFGGGCTGEIISKNGLLLTNHHCGFSSIQKHSSLDNNYLKEGFWAKNRLEELPNKDLTVSFLKEIQEYTSIVTGNLDKGLDLEGQRQKINFRIDSLEKLLSDSLKLEASIEKFYAGNDYYLFLYQIYKDVRLVGAPPSSIGNFGGDTDNWVWPRHTGDFSLFRVYSDPNGDPADYAEENIPFTPKKYLSISAQGVEEGDFTMVLGYPGTTQEYLYSAGLELVNDKLYPTNVRLRNGRLDIINNGRRKDEQVYIQYATKQQRVSNAWKKWKGVLYGFNRFNVIEKRQEYETWLLSHAKSNKPQLQELYEMFEDVYLGYEPYKLASEYYRESVLAIEPLIFYGRGILRNINNLSLGNISKEEAISNITEKSSEYFKNYNIGIDKVLTEFILTNFNSDLGDDFQPDILLANSNTEALNKFINTIYSKSVLTDSNRFKKALNKFISGDLEVFLKDPIAELYYQVVQFKRTEIDEEYRYYLDQLNQLNKEYIGLIRKIDTTRPIYPDANFTMRMTYGKVGGYSPGDAVTYSHQTYLGGIIDKVGMDVHDYKIPRKLAELYQTSDYGKYGTSDGKLPICFIASNHTSGGNSGSPVLDAKGRLIGVNFDRTWEGTMSDYNFDEEICRNISVDIRYVLFIIDKFADCGYLFDEMDIVW